MRITATDRARDVVARMAERRPGVLTVTIGTGCCESTAPFLYEDFWPGPDQAEVGDVDGVKVYAPQYLRDLYPGEQSMVLDVADEMAESLSIETELGIRLVLRGEGERAAAPACEVPAAVGARPVVGELPEALRNLRMR